jgi:hypothetical protein
MWVDWHLACEFGRVREVRDVVGAMQLEIRRKQIKPEWVF